MAPRRSKRTRQTDKNQESPDNKNAKKQVAADDTNPQDNTSYKGTRSTKRTRYSRPELIVNDSGRVTVPKLENACGLATLPTELLAEVTAYLPSLEIPFKENISEPICRNEQGLSRLNFLRALSQTCRHLRSFALPLCWETIEVISCDAKELGRNWRQFMATELIRQLEVVTVRDPSLAQYVRVVNIMITSYSAKAVIKELADCLVQLPNLNTLQVLGEGKTALYFENAFKDVHLPTIQILGLIPDASCILKSCTNVRKVWGLPFIYSYPDLMPHVEDLRCNIISLCRSNLSTRFPNLKVVDLSQRKRNFGYEEIPGCFEKIQRLKDLRCVRIHYTFSDFSAKVASRSPYYNVQERCRRLLEAYPPPLSDCHRCIILTFEYPSKETEHHLVSGTSKGKCVYL